MTKNKQPSTVEELKEIPGMVVRNSPVFKLKDKKLRNLLPIDLEKEFGFQPKLIVIEKVRGRNNTFFVRAVLTEEEREKQDAIIAKKNKKTVEAKPRIVIPKGNAKKGGK